MVACPQCHAPFAPPKSHTRLRCGNCGKRFTFTRAWDSLRMATRKKEALLDAFCAGKSARSQRTVERSHRVSDLTRETVYRWFRACAVLAVGPPTSAQPLAVTLATGATQIGVVVSLHSMLRRPEIAFGEGKAGEVQLRHLTAMYAPGALWRDPTGKRAAIHLQVMQRVVHSSKKPDRTVPYALVPTDWRRQKYSDPSCPEEVFLRILAAVVRQCPVIPIKHLDLYVGEALLRFAHRNGGFEATVWDLISTTPASEVRKILRRSR